MTRNERILSLRGTFSYSIIAEHVGVSRNVVAGVCWRADWPPGTRKGKNKNKCGRGYHGAGPEADLTLREMRP